MQNSPTDEPPNRTRAVALFRRLASWLTEPPSHLSDVEDRLQAQVWSVIILALAILGIVVAGVPAWLGGGRSPWSDPVFLLSFGAAILLIVAYGLSRTIRFRLAAWLVILISMGAVIAASLLGSEPDSYGLLSYLLIPILLGTLLGREWPVVFLIAAGLGATLIFPVLVPSVGYDAILIGPFSYILLMSALFLLVLRYRRYIDSARRGALAETGARLAAFAHALPDLGFILDETGRYADILTHRPDLLYTDEDNLRGRFLHDMLPQREADLIHAAIRRTIDSGVMQVVEYALDVPAGHRWFEGRMAPMQSLPGEPRRVALIARDITERKRAQEALSASEHRIRSIFETIPGAVLAVNSTGHIAMANRQVWAVFGYQPQELVGQPVEALLPERYRSSHPGLQAQYLAAPGPRPMGAGRDLAGRRKDGSEFPVEVGLNHSQLGDEALTIAFITDITERKRAEESIRKLNRVYAVLSNINQAIVRIRQPHELLEKACQIAIDDGGFLMAWIGLLDPHTGAIMVAANADAGQSDGYLEKLVVELNREPRGSGPTATAIHTRERVICNDIERDPAMARTRADALRLGYRSLAVFPLIVSGEVRGVFDLYSDEPGFFDEEEIVLLAELAQDISFALEFAEQEAQRQQAERALQVSKERLQATLDNMLEGCQIIGFDWRYLYLNETAAEQGRRAKEELIGRTMMEAYPGIEETALFTVLRRCMSERLAERLENEFTYPDGTTGWFELSVEPVPEGLFILSIDITEPKQAEEALHESEQRFRRLFELSPDAIVLIDPHHTGVSWPIIDCNEVACQMNGYPRSEIIGQSIDILHEVPAVPAERDAYLERLHSEGVFRGEAVHRRKDGTLFPIMFATSLIALGDRELVLGIDRDITERKQAEQKLLAERNRAQEYLDVAGVMLLALNGGGEITLINRRGCQILGYEETELLGKDWVETCLPGHVREDVRGRFLELIAGDVERYRHLENDVLTKAGAQRTIAWSNSLIRDETGAITGVLSSGEDITERRQAEEALQRRATQMMLIYSISRQVATVLDLDSLLDQTVSLVQESFDYQHVAVYLVDRNDGDLVMSARAGVYADRFHPEHRLKRGQGLNGWVAQHGERVLANDARADPRFHNPFGDDFIQSELSVPIRLADEVVGVLDVQSQQVNAFTGDDVTVLEILADTLATAIHNARLFEQARRRAEELEALRQATLDISTELDLNDLLASLIQTAVRLLGAVSGGIYLYRPEPDLLEWVAGAGPTVVPKGALLKRGEGLSGRVWEAGTPLIIEDYSTWEGRVPTYRADTVGALIGVPITWGDQFLGVINAALQTSTPHTFTEDDARLLSLFADQAAVAIQNARLFEQAQHEIAERARAEQRIERLLSQQLTINRLALSLGYSSDLERVYQTIYDHVRELMDAQILIISFYDAQQQLITAGYAAAKGEALDVSGLPPIPLEPEGQGTQSQVIRSGQPLYVPDLRQALKRVNTEYATDDDGTVSEGPPPEDEKRAQSALYAPMQIEGQTIGVIQVQSYHLDAYTGDDLSLLNGLASVAAIAIQNARLYGELESYSEFLKQAVEEATADLQRGMQRVSAILDNNPDPILLLGPDGAVDTGNPIFTQFFGYDLDEVYGWSPSRLAAPDHAGALEAVLQDVLRSMETRRLELVARRKDGATFDASVALAPIREGSTLLGVVCNLRDISALKEVERMKDAFVSNVSHELRTPITSLKLNQRLLEVDPGKKDVYLARLGREIDRLNRIIEDLLRLSRLDQGRVELNLALTDLNGLAAQYVTDRTPLAESRGLTLVCEQTPDLPPVQADESLLGQALSVLLTNALNYTPPGGRVTVRTGQRRVQGRHWAGFSVVDTGPGIPPEEQPHLFERFFRGKAGRESGAPGTGLGLPIAREIVERHHGTIEVLSNSTPGSGATFTVWLPVAD